MSLVANYSSSSESDTDESNSEDESQEYQQSSAAETHQTVEKLPAPGFLLGTSESDAKTSSVFQNPFKEAEDAKKAILEKHVKMVDNKVDTINGKKICWNYRKGRCRFGHNCKYAHGSDLQKTQEQLQQDKESSETVLCDSTDGRVKSKVSSVKEESGKKGKKRPGLSQGLVPGKKVMKMYFDSKGGPR